LLAHREPRISFPGKAGRPFPALGAARPCFGFGGAGPRPGKAVSRMPWGEGACRRPCFRISTKSNSFWGKLQGMCVNLALLGTVRVLQDAPARDLGAWGRSFVGPDLLMFVPWILKLDAISHNFPTGMRLLTPQGRPAGGPGRREASPEVGIGAPRMGLAAACQGGGRQGVNSKVKPSLGQGVKSKAKAPGTRPRDPGAPGRPSRPSGLAFGAC
jgi:hypothetical protein